MGCAYVTSGQPCGVRWDSFLDMEFFTLSFVPWLIGALCLYFAMRKAEADPEAEDDASFEGKTASFHQMMSTI
jgi:hypothetical protein